MSTKKQANPDDATLITGGGRKTPKAKSRNDLSIEKACPLSLPSKITTIGRTKMPNSEKPESARMTRDELLQFIRLLFDQGAVEALVVSNAAVNILTVTTDMRLDSNGTWIFLRIPEKLALSELGAEPGDLIALVQNSKDKDEDEEQKEEVLSVGGSK